MNLNLHVIYNLVSGIEARKDSLSPATLLPLRTLFWFEGEKSLSVPGIVYEKGTYIHGKKPKMIWMRICKFFLKNIYSCIPHSKNRKSECWWDKHFLVLEKRTLRLNVLFQFYLWSHTSNYLSLPLTIHFILILKVIEKKLAPLKWSISGNARLNM